MAMVDLAQWYATAYQSSGERESDKERDIEGGRERDRQRERKREGETDRTREGERKRNKAQFKNISFLLYMEAYYPLHSSRSFEILRWNPGGGISLWSTVSQLYPLVALHV